jgi:hypothetical protein
MRVVERGIGGEAFGQRWRLRGAEEVEEEGCGRMWTRSEACLRMPSDPNVAGTGAVE